VPDALLAHGARRLVQLLEMEGFSEASLAIRNSVKDLANIACSIIAAVLTGGRRLLLPAAAAAACCCRRCCCCCCCCCCCPLDDLACC
jgi:hypothetical protein